MNAAMKKNSGIYLATLEIVLLLLALQFFRPRALKRVFFVDYKTLFEKTKTVEIATFQTGEAWQGDFTLDTERSFDSETGLNFYSMGGKTNTITLTKRFDLSPVDTAHLSIFSPEASISQHIESLTLRFASSEKEMFESPISLKKAGWNYISIPLNSFTKAGSPDWKKIQSVSIILTSKKAATVQLSLDRIWAEKHDIPNPMISTPYGSFMNLKTVEGNTFLHTGSSDPFPLTIRQQSEGNRFAYIVSFIPLKHQTFCLTFNSAETRESGYLFCIEGGKLNEWKLLKQNHNKQTLLSKGALRGAAVEKNTYTWLRVEKDGPTIRAGISFNGTAFETVNSIKDASFDKGTLGIIAEGSYLINTIEVMK
ncbi:hypothetical protein COY90_01625 [Candidatus Roizmanbacteria bacterium CG_4_10_14_0_8_um_filter_39_9]|uniref:Uncharacterized protein n=1 Tax=Candidatus Roizmanbacteria bacterium CG_4_10_14_0_8_um_filter_39_9 TaxID=1974829 RepID=A0A2M7QDF3_9BACT|nr:MAG: hypothetical protein COY90_01625 [Candidatus Roizmanbacteria bacterium CG_4_10_14_0_8_um_filter_39_9]